MDPTATGSPDTAHINPALRNVQFTNHPYRSMMGMNDTMSKPSLVVFPAIMKYCSIRNPELTQYDTFRAEVCLAP